MGDDPKVTAPMEGAVEARAAPMEDLVERVLRRIPSGRDRRVEGEILYRDAHSNDVAEVHFSDDRILHVKRARGPGGRERCASAALASRLLRERVGLPVPVHLDLQPPLDEPVVAYWRIRGPTLDSVVAAWRSGAADRAVLESFGGLLGRIQAVRFPAHGPLDAPERTLGAHLEEDVRGRLRPAVYGEWPEGAEPLERLLYVIDRWVRGDESPAVLVHNDLHAENVLCRAAGDSHRCVGLIDLEDAFAGPPEADLAKVEVLHGPLFGQPWPSEWLDEVVRGYGRAPDPFRLGVLRVYHLLNLGFHAAFLGYAERAGQVATVAGLELDALGESRSHSQVAGG